MTMDEVNDKFPMMKYKTWVADRAKDGLPTTGGVSISPSRANSIRSVQGIVPDLPSMGEEHTESTPKTENKPQADPENHGVTSASGNENETTLTHTQTAASIVTKDPDHAHGSDDEEDEEHIDAALPPELMGTSGDTCAICIDTLEDDDDVRGLTCGHAFHAVCLDPWLTNRRACCPLCKADYYTPKPRPPPVEGEAMGAGANPVDPARNNGRLNMPRSPQRALGGWSLRGGPRAVFGRYGGNPNSRNNASTGVPPVSERRYVYRRPETTRATPSQNQGAQGESMFARLRGRLPSMGRSVGQRHADTSAPGANNTPATPSQLEAGTRSAT
jgi:hypothetical protein